MSAVEPINVHAGVETKRVTPRAGAVLDDDGTPDEGWRFRMVCRCGDKGAWRRNGNDATEAAEAHAYRKHGYGS